MVKASVIPNFSYILPNKSAYFTLCMKALSLCFHVHIDDSTEEGVILSVLTISTHDTHKVLGAALEIIF